MTRNDVPSSTGWALTTTFLLMRRSSSPSLPKDGRTVSKSLEEVLPCLTAVRNLPWIVSPLVEISLTLPWVTWARKVV